MAKGHSQPAILISQPRARAGPAIATPATDSHQEAV